LGGTTLTRRNQLEAYPSKKGTSLAKSFVRAKVENMGYFLKTLGKSRDNESLKETGKGILNFSKRIKSLDGGIDKIRNELLGIEGESSKTYFAALRQVLPEKLYSGSRSKRPPRDVFNAFLSYGYGILYSEIERACIVSGLDPYLGFLHTDRYGKPSMVLDLIEEFRQPIVDRAMITLVVRNQIDESSVDREKGIYLNKRGRKTAIEALMSRLETKIKYKGKNLSLQDIILKQARDIVRFVNNERRVYKPFVYRW
jgi:CRISPR-associated protein Cas1